MGSVANFPFECLEEVFLRLNGSELLKCTLVCPEWNQLISSTTLCMRKIKFCFWHPNEKSFLLTKNSGWVGAKVDADKVLINSNRKYECIIIEKRYLTDIHSILSAKGRKWTHIDAPPVSAFNNSQHFVDFLRVFQFSVLKFQFLPHIEIFGIDNNVSDVDTSDLQFP